MPFLKTHIISLLSNYSLKRFLTLFFICFLGMAFISSSFISCAPGFDSPNSGDDDDGDDGDDDNGDDDDDEIDDNRDDGGTCKGNEDCEWICEKIYTEYSEKEKCVDEGDKKVDRLKTIHDLLIAPNKTRSAKTLLKDLKTISESDDDEDDEAAIRVVDLRYYLALGTTKYVEAIKSNLTDTLLMTTLKWIIDNGEVAEAISKADKKEKVLEALLVQVNSRGGVDCISDDGNIVSTTVTDKDKDTYLWGVSESEKTIKIAYHSESVEPVRPISFNREDKFETYDALSCQYVILGNRNVFTYAAKKNNNVVFDMAFDLLDNACENVDQIKNQDKACARSMICWSAWMDVNKEGSVGSRNRDNPPEASSDFWSMAEKHKEKLKTEDGDSSYNDCTAGAFSEFF